MSALDRALAFAGPHEGDRYTDDPNDPGGPTRWGVSLRFLRSLGHDQADIDGDGDIDQDDVKDLTWDDACRLFWIPEFWSKYGWDRLPDSIAVKVFDLGINVGPAQVHRFLQRACRAVGVPLKDDGVLGPKTLGAVLALTVGTSALALLASIASEAAGFYRLLDATKPWARDGKYLNGWLNRAYARE